MTDETNTYFQIMEQADSKSTFTDGQFKAWVEENVEAFAKEAADKAGTTLEELLGITYDYETIDDDARFADDYEAACEFEWECRTGR